MWTEYIKTRCLQSIKSFIALLPKLLVWTLFLRIWTQKLEVRVVHKFCWLRLQGLSLLVYGPGQGQMLRRDSKKKAKLRIPLQDIQSLMDFSSIFLIVAWIHLQPWHLLCSGTVTSTVCLPWAWRNNPFYLCWTWHWLVSSGAFQYLFWKRQGISIFIYLFHTAHDFFDFCSSSLQSVLSQVEVS